LANFEIFHHLDERSAAFFALGLSMNTHKPVAIICTSGTAVAECLPAMVEAYYQKIPLIVVSADRPQSYRGSGAPQSIEQVGIFSHYAKSFDVQKVEDFPPLDLLSYPLHFNICLEEAALGDWPEENARQSLKIPKCGAEKSISPIAKKEISAFVDSSDNLLVILGSLSPEEAEHLAPFLQKLAAPILADSPSNIRGQETLRCGEMLLKHSKPTHVLRFGSVPSFRFWRDLEENTIEVLSVSLQKFSGLGRDSRICSVDSYRGLKDLEVESKKSYSFQEQDQVLSHKLEELLREYPISELSLLKALTTQMSPNSMLYLGNSLPIREWNLVNGQHSPCYANRGANGIDGQISTFLGIAQGFDESWAVVGDQTALYDLNALALSAQRRIKNRKKKIKRRIVVINNRGGKIFSHLKYSRDLDMLQRRLLENHHRWELRSWAELFSWGYEAWDKDAAIYNPEVDDMVLEIFPDASQTQHFWEAWRKL